MSILSEAEKFIATAITDIETAESNVATVVNNPLIAPFVLQVKHSIETTLTKFGLPVSQIESIGVELLAGLNHVAKQAAKAAVVT